MAKCKNCTRLYKNMEEETDNFGLVWCDKICDSPDVEEERDCMFFNAMTNGDRIRRMTDEELADIVFCPYDTAGEPEEIMPCLWEQETQTMVAQDKCKACMMAWLGKEVNEK